MNKFLATQKCGTCGKVSYGLTNTVVKYCRHCKTNVGHVCPHESLEKGGNFCSHCGLSEVELSRSDTVILSEALQYCITQGGAHCLQAEGDRLALIMNRLQAINEVAREALANVEALS